MSKVKENLTVKYGKGSLDIDAITEHVSNRIIDEWAEGETGFRKWSNGIFEQWGNFDNPIHTPTAAGNSFYGDDIEAIFPYPFFPGKRVSVNQWIICSATIAESQLRYTTAHRFTFINKSPFRYLTGTLPSRLFWEASGFWK